MFIAFHDDAGRKWIKFYLFFDIIQAVVDDLTFPVGDRDVCAGIEERLL
jgi:hypothetical protein